MPKRIIYILVILTVALLLRLNLAVTTQDFPKDDALEYENLARNILSGRGYVGSDGMPTSFRPPLYPFLLAAIYFVFGHSYLAVRLFQACLGTLTVLLFYLIGRRVHSEKVGILSGLLAAIYPSYIILTKFLLTETVFTFLLALSIFDLLRMRSLKSILTPILLGITLGLLSLTRSTAIALPAVYTLLLFVGIPKGSAGRASYFAGIMVLVYFMALAPWCCRNTAVHGRPVLISTNGGLNLYQAVTPKDGKIFGLVPSDRDIETSRQMANEAERDRFLFSRGMEKMVRNPVLGLKFAVMRSLFYWGFFDWEVQKGVEYNYIYGAALPFFIIGAFLAFRPMRQSGILLCVIAYFFLIILASQGTVRYRLPTDGYIFIIASSAIIHTIKKARNKASSLSWISAWFLVNYWFFVNSSLVKTFLKEGVKRIGLW